MSSDDGHMSDYDFVDLQETNVYSSDDDSTVTSSLAPPRGWSTLSLSDADAAAAAASAVKTGPVTVASAAAYVRRDFISAAATIVQPARGSTSTPVSACLECSVCQRLLRDCVECPTCHSLFCRTHLHIDSGSGKSPCPCKPCLPAAAAAAAAAAVSAEQEEAPASTAATTTPQLHPASAFLPNIPVQRMADAVPSRCDGCGVSLSWGELGLHACDRQLVPCDGCGWVGERRLLERHASTCVGKELAARARREVLAAEAERDLARRDGEAAERRASSAEARASELEKALALKTEEAAALRTEAALHARKGDELQRLLQEARAARPTVGMAAAAAVAKLDASATRGSGAALPGETVVGQRRVVLAPPSSGFPPFGGAAGSAAPAPKNKKSGTTLGAAATTTQTAAVSTATRASGRSSGGGVGSSSSKGVLHAAAKQTTRGSSGGVMMDTACQAPVPSVEACLRPYLDRPSSLLEKKVVVFWPRQGRWYIGRPTVYKAATKEHRVEYDDGDVRDHVLAHRSWGLIG